MTIARSNGRHASTGQSMLRRSGVVLAHWSASKRLQRRPLALRAIFRAHAPMHSVSGRVPRLSILKTRVIAAPAQKGGSGFLWLVGEVERELDHVVIRRLPPMNFGVAGLAQRD